MSQILARFDDPKALAAAIRALRERGIDRLDAVMPFESEDVKRALAPNPTRIGWLAGAAALTGLVLAWAIIDWTNGHDYPLDVGGRPIHSYVADVPIMFETSILVAGVTAFFAFFAASCLPRLHHPWFEVDLDAFWLVILDAREATETTRILLQEHGATEMREVPA